MLPLLASLCLPACGQGPVADNAENAAALPAPATVNSSDPSGGAPPANALSRQVNSRSSGSIPAIPAKLQGRWGLNPEDCFPNRGDNLGVLEISASEVRFHESVARPRGNANAGDDSYGADFTFTGEGQSWNRFETMRLENGKLVRTESSPMASYTYAKCS